jgi:hypothetical protein
MARLSEPVGYASGRARLARVVELADTLASKSSAPGGACGFKSHPGHPVR